MSPSPMDPESQSHCAPSVPWKPAQSSALVVVLLSLTRRELGALLSQAFQPPLSEAFSLLPLWCEVGGLPLALWARCEYLNDSSDHSSDQLACLGLDSLHKLWVCLRRVLGWKGAQTHHANNVFRGCGKLRWLKLPTLIRGQARKKS